MSEPTEEAALRIEQLEAAYEDAISALRYLVLDHLCRQRRCVNPVHLELVTTAENLRRGVGQKQKDKCRRGHPMIDPIVEKSGARRCRLCSRAKNQAFYRRGRHD